MLRQRAVRHALVFAVLIVAMASATAVTPAAQPAPVRAVAAVHATPVAYHVVHRSTYHTARRLAVHRRLQHELVFVWPAQGVITTPFHPAAGPGHHDGIDIGSLRSPTIVAAHSGRVLHVGYTTGFEGYGNIVDVEVAPGVETLYAHLSAMRVHVGQRIEAGEVVGTAGCTGICYGTHLHFEVRRGGAPIDPLAFLSRG